MFVIYISGLGYYQGSTYMSEGGYYPCITNRISEAKTYKTRKIAERSACALENKMDYPSACIVEELDTKGE